MRYPDWQKRFWAEVERQRAVAFVWGERDCVLAAATVADAVSDAQHVQRTRTAFAWSSAREAAALIGGGELQSLVETVMGPMLPWPQLRMADLALVVDEKNRQSIAVHDGTQFIGPVDPGWQVIPFRYVRGGWHVT